MGINTGIIWTYFLVLICSIEKHFVENYQENLEERSDWRGRFFEELEIRNPRFTYCNKQIFPAFLFNIRSYSPEVRNVQRREAEWIISVLIKQKMAWNIYFFNIPQAPTKSGWMLTRHIIFQWQHNSLFFKRKFNWNNYFELFDINCRYLFFGEITQALSIISKSIEFELRHMNLKTLKVDPRSNHETCFR